MCRQHFFINHVKHMRAGRHVGQGVSFPIFPACHRAEKPKSARNGNEVNHGGEDVEVGEAVEIKMPTYDPVIIIRKSRHCRWTKSTSGVHASTCVWHSESKI